MVPDPELGSSRDMPLRLPWFRKDAVSAVQDAHGVSRVEAMVLVALETEARKGGRWVSYSRNRNHYAIPRRYRHPYYTYAKIPPIFDRLEARGMIEHDRAAPNRREWQSRARLLPDAQAGIQQLILDPPIEPLILRDAQGQPIDYRDTRQTRRKRRFLQECNDALRAEGFPPMVRIWNRTMKRGGRFYAVGGGWQSMRSQERQEITIAGEPTVEIDYRAMHPSMLYALAEEELPADPYAVGGWPRPLVKVALLILINAETEQKARQSLAQQDAMAEVARPGSQEAFQAAAQLIRDLSEYHAPIAGYFGNDMGAVLMETDSLIAEDVMKAMLYNHGETVLPVHDSFIVRESAAQKLEEAMQEAAYCILGIVLETESKRRGHLEAIK